MSHSPENPEIRVSLVDSTEKSTIFLTEVKGTDFSQEDLAVVMSTFLREAAALQTQAGKENKNINIVVYEGAKVAPDLSALNGAISAAVATLLEKNIASYFGFLDLIITVRSGFSETDMPVDFGSKVISSTGLTRLEMVDTLQDALALAEDFSK